MNTTEKVAANSATSLTVATEQTLYKLTNLNQGVTLREFHWRVSRLSHKSYNWTGFHFVPFSYVWRMFTLGIYQLSHGIVRSFKMLCFILLVFHASVLLLIMHSAVKVAGDPWWERWAQNCSWTCYHQRNLAQKVRWKATVRCVVL